MMIYGVGSEKKYDKLKVGQLIWFCLMPTYYIRSQENVLTFLIDHAVDFLFASDSGDILI